MKYFALLFVSAGLGFAADFTTGQAARLIIGQPNFTRQEPGASDSRLGAASGVAYANDTLIVADSNRIGASPENHRVLIYRNLSKSLPAPKAEIPQGVRCPICLGTADTVLGQPDFSATGVALTQSGMRLPTGVATDGKIVAVADTDNNRVLIWNSIPSGNGTPADVVVGQPDFKSSRSNFGNGNTPTAQGLRGPQGVWIQDGRFFVADTQNHRVLIWNRIPSSNGQAADVVLGQASFTSFVEPDLTKLSTEAKANNLLNPVSVTSDGTRLYVTDLGHNRVLIWNSIPTQNQAPADIALGQPDVNSSSTVNVSLANNSSLLCPATGTKDANGKDIFPARCAATLNFPRYALSDGTRLFVADGGNNRVLVYNSIPTANGQRADIIIGQPDEGSSVDSDPALDSSSDTLRTPMSLAWDGTNLYVSDPFNRRVLVFTVADISTVRSAIRNAASQEIFAVATVTFSGGIRENDTATITIGDKTYTYKIVKDDTFQTIVKNFVDLINANGGDPLVLARANPNANAIVLTSRKSGDTGNSVALSAATTPSDATIVVATSSSTLNGGQDAAKIAPGTLVIITGQNLANDTATADPSKDSLPTTLAGVQVYFDGIRAPLLYVSPTQINAQVPFEISDASSISGFIRIVDAAGNVKTTTAVGVPVIPQNPGIFAASGDDPRPALAYHYSSYATGAISVDGTIKAGDVATITIEDRPYNYTVTADDTLATIRDNLINLINANPDEKVTAFAAGSFTRIRLKSKTPGKDGEGIAYTASVPTSASLILSPLGSALCCASTAGLPVTDANPAVPGETIVIYATGLGLVGPDEALQASITGAKYTGPAVNNVNSPVDAIAGGKTANVFLAGLKPGTVGIYELQLQLNADLPTDPLTQLTIAQDIYISNIVTFPVVNPTPPSP